MSFSPSFNLPNKSWLALTLAFGLGAFANYILRAPRSIEAASGRRNQEGNAFVLGVTATFPSIEAKEDFKRLFRPLAEYVEKFELGTYTYKLLESDKDAKRVQVLERYQDKEYYLNVHKASAPFLKFREELQVMISKGTVLDGESYLETDIGFL